jgi:hypothetical protein
MTVSQKMERVGDSIVELSDSGQQWKPIAAPLHVSIDNVDRRAIAAGRPLHGLHTADGT